MMTLKNIKQVEEIQMREEDLEELYTWIDGIPLSRKKRNMARDFADGVLVAEVIKDRFHQLVDLHNYTPSNGSHQKMQNWIQLNTKVFRKLHLELSEDIMQEIIAAKPGIIERVLIILKTRLECVQWDTKTKRKYTKISENERPESDQNIASRMSSLRDVNATVSQGGVTFAPASFSKGGSFPQEDTVPVILLEEKEQELLMKEETTQILQCKIKRLEHLLHLKDIRIEDMQKRLEPKQRPGKR